MGRSVDGISFRLSLNTIHRTARAGCGGRAITLVSDARRKVMKDVLKDQANKAAGV